MSDEYLNGSAPEMEPAAENQPGQAPGEAPEQELDPVAQLIAERDELKDRMLRMAAETENYKKRAEREKSEFLKRATESLLKDLLPVLDNLERALEHADQKSEHQSLVEGLDLTHQELWKVLERHGLERVESVGQPFDPELHEAMMQQEDLEAEDNTVLTEFQKGYRHQGRLLRPAMVVVSKRPEEPEDTGQEIKITIN